MRPAPQPYSPVGRHRCARLLGACLLVMLASACEQPEPTSGALREGERLPALTLTTLEGVEAPLSLYAGKALVLNVWATWCAPCREEMPSLQRLAERLDPARFAVLGLSLDEDAFIVREFLIERKVHFPNFIDADSSIANQTLGVKVVPSTFLVRADGTLDRVVLGPREWDDASSMALIADLAPQQGN